MAKSVRRRSPLAGMSVSMLEAELRERRGRVAKLSKLHKQTYAKLQSIEKDLAALGTSIGRGRGGATVRRRPSNTMTLVEALHKLLSGKTLNVTRITTAVQDAGYKTNSPNFRTIVNQTLINNAGKFKKVGRGLYTSK